MPHWDPFMWYVCQTPVKFHAVLSQTGIWTHLDWCTHVSVEWLELALCSTGGYLTPQAWQLGPCKHYIMDWCIRISHVTGALTTSAISTNPLLLHTRICTKNPLLCTHHPLLDHKSAVEIHSIYYDNTPASAHIGLWNCSQTTWMMWFLCFTW